MAFIPTLACVQATLDFEGSGGLFAQNRLYVATPAAPTETDLHNIDDALYPAVDANYVQHMSGFWQLNAITYRAMNEAEGIQLNSTHVFPREGGEGDSEMEAAQVCYTVTLNTGLVGRSARGRVYGVGLWNAAADGSRLTTGAQSTLQSAWSLIIGAMETAGYAIQVVSFFEGGVARAAGRKLPVLSVAVRFPLATQRRRLS